MWTIVFHERRPPGPHQGFAVGPGGGHSGVPAQLGSQSLMTEQKSSVRKRSIMLFGRKTSVSLEEPFWQALHEIATERGITTAALLNSIASKRAPGNLSSALRVFVLEHFRAAYQKETKA